MNTAWARLKGIFDWASPILIMLCCVVFLDGKWGIRILPLFFLGALITFTIMVLVSWKFKDSISLIGILALLFISEYLSFQVFDFARFMFPGFIGGIVSGWLFGRKVRGRKRSD